MHPLLQFFSLSLGKYIQTIIGSYFSTVQKDTALGKVQVVMYKCLTIRADPFTNSNLWRILDANGLVFTSPATNNLSTHITYLMNAPLFTFI